MGGARGVGFWLWSHPVAFLVVTLTEERPAGVLAGGPEGGEDARERRRAAGLPLVRQSWPGWVSEQAMVVAARMVDGSITPDEADARLKILERVNRLLSPGSGPGPGRPAKSVAGRRANDPLLEAQLAELAEVLEERG